MRRVDSRGHWEGVHASKRADEVSWYQAEPLTSLRLLETLRLGSEARVLDVGCGQWGLAPALAERGFRDVTAIDVSRTAIERSRGRAGASAEKIQWVEADARTFHAPEPFDCWHDRAVFHFFTDPVDRSRYLESLARNLVRGGVAILATFANDGPEKCSGLPVARYDAKGLAAALGARFAQVASERESHRTPRGVEQRFTWGVFRKV